MTITINTQPDARRIYQRTAKTGGLNNLGEKGVTFNITLSGAVSNFEYRVLEDTTLTEIVTWVSLGALGAGAQDVVCTVPADQRWYVVEFREDGAGNVTSTNKFGVGRILAVSGQSLGSRCFITADDVVGDPTYASQGFTVSDFVSAYATINDTQSVATAVWAKPADAGTYDSLFLGYFGNDQVDEYGVNVAIAGHCAGDQAIFRFIPGGTENAAMRAILDAVDGFEVFIWMQGYADSSVPNASNEYYDNLVTLIADVSSRNTLGSYEKWLNAINNVEISNYGNQFDINGIRYAQRRYAGANSDSKYLDCADIRIHDGVHQNMFGAIDFARHFQRLDVGSDQGPVPIYTSKSGADITIIYNKTLSLVGNAANCFSAYRQDTSASLTISSATVSGQQVVLTLSADPGTVPIEIYANPAVVANTIDNQIYDTDTTDGFSVGRHIQTSIDPIIGHDMNVNLTGNSDVYATAAPGFGQHLSSGDCEASDIYRPLPKSNTFTVEFWAQISSAPGNYQVMVGQPNRFYVACTAGGQLSINYMRWNFSAFQDDTAVSITGVSPKHFSLNFSDYGMRIFVDGVLASSNTVPILNNIAGFGNNNEFQIARYNGVADFDFAGIIDEVAVFNAEKRTVNFTPPTAPYVGDESNLIAIYHLDGDSSAGTITPPLISVESSNNTYIGIGISI